MKPLARHLIAAGIPVIAVGPGDIPRQSGWQNLTAEQCDLSLFRPGDALAMVGGHGIDAVDVDLKNGGSVDNLPPFKSYGETTTPSGGAHYIVPSSGLGKITPLTTAFGHVGDYVGGRPDGSGRLLLFLPGSKRSKYPSGGYVETVPWDIEACLAAVPDPTLVEALEKAGGGRESSAHDHYVYDGPDRDPALGVAPAAKAMVAAELARLDECDVLGWDGPPWDQTTYNVACRLVELGNSGWTGYDVDELNDLFLAHAPTDPDFGPVKHQEKWKSALLKVGNGGIRLHSTPEEDFGPVEDELFDATPTLQHIRQAAHARMLGAPALLCYVLARVIAETPAGVCLPPTIGGKASLNLGIAVVGDSGAGKSALLSVSRELLAMTGADQEDIERNVGSGEGMVQSFLRKDSITKELALIDDPRRIFAVDEIDSLGAGKNRTGATIAPTIRSALTGSSLGQENADVDRRRHVKANSYRLVLLVGVQPTRSGALLEDADAGTPQRLVWVQANDPAIPDHAEWPGVLPGENLGWALPPTLPDEIVYPGHVAAQIRAARLKQMREGTGALEGHRLLTRLKASAGLALLHGETKISDQWWGLAERVIAESMRVQEVCQRALEAEAAKANEKQARAAGHAAITVAEVMDENKQGVARASASIMRKLESADGEGVVWRDVTRAMKNTIRPYAQKAKSSLEANGQIRVEDVTVGSRQGERLWKA